jgi:ribosomal protein L29
VARNAKKEIARIMTELGALRREAKTK